MKEMITNELFAWRIRLTESRIVWPVPFRVYTVVGESQRGCPLYTQSEWKCGESSDFEVNDEGEFLFQGEPFAGTVRPASVPRWAIRD